WVAVGGGAVAGRESTDVLPEAVLGCAGLWPVPATCADTAWSGLVLGVAGWVAWPLPGRGAGATGAGLPGGYCGLMARRVIAASTASGRAPFRVPPSPFASTLGSARARR